MDMTLLIMAAGMGSRYGGDKQVDGMGPHGAILVEYSIHDAIAAGFNKVVLIIKRDFEERFRTLVGDKIKDKVKVQYVYQEFSNLPGGYAVPAARVKPFGTVHAVLCAKDAIHEPFAVINADDYYGKQAFTIMAERLKTLRPEGEACMPGYYLKNTVSENGHVTRGVCSLNDAGRLTRITETYQIKPFPDGTIRDTYQDPAGVPLDPNCLVSMNFFGFTPWIFGQAETRLKAFLAGLSPDELKKEYVLPVLVDQLMHEAGLQVDVLPTDAVWFGVTYKEDKPYVQGELLAMHQNGQYPDQLF